MQSLVGLGFTVALLVVVATESSSDECAVALGSDEDPHKLRIMPFGDSISICCHHCGVSAAILPPWMKHRAEPPAAYEGYIKKLWRHLFRFYTVGMEDPSETPWQDSGLDLPSLEHVHGSLPFRFVGRVRTCMTNRSTTTRVPTHDWEVMYEAHYGYTTKRVNREVVNPAMATQDPDIVLMHLGTNDMISPKYSTFGLGRVDFAMILYKQIVEAIMTDRAEGSAKKSRPSVATRCPQSGLQRRRRTRHLFASLIIPFDESSLPDTGRSGRSPIRGKVGHFNSELLRLLVPLQLQFPVNGSESALSAAREVFKAAQQSVAKPSYDWLRNFSIGTLNAISRIHVVDMYTNFSAKSDLHGDGLHPNDVGERKIARKYFEALLPFIGKDRHRHFPHLRGSPNPPVTQQHRVVSLPFAAEETDGAGNAFLPVIAVVTLLFAVCSRLLWRHCRAKKR